MEPWKVKCKVCEEITPVNFWEAKDTGLSEPSNGCGEVITMTVTQRPGDGDPNTVIFKANLGPNFELVWD